MHDNGMAPEIARLHRAGYILMMRIFQSGPLYDALDDEEKAAMDVFRPVLVAARDSNA